MPPDDKFSVTMPPELGAAVRKAAAQQGRSVASSLADVASDRVRNELLGAAVDAWEAEDGPFTQQEPDDASATLGFQRQMPSA